MCGSHMRVETVWGLAVSCTPTLDFSLSSSTYYIPSSIPYRGPHPCKLPLLCLFNQRCLTKYPEACRAQLILQFCLSSLPEEDQASCCKRFSEVLEVFPLIHVSFLSDITSQALIYKCKMFLYVSKVLDITKEICNYFFYSVWPVPRLTHHDLWVPICRATSSRIGWWTSCPTRARVCVFSQSEEWRDLTISTPASLMDTGWKKLN